MTAPNLLARPIYGGIIGRGGRYALATMPHVSRGLHAVRFMVIEAKAGTVLAVSDSKVHALATARQVIETTDEPLAPLQGRLWPEEPAPGPSTPPRRPSRRRRTIFGRSGGRCFYCHCRLQLDGPWHIEHQLPRALGGRNELVNLVAACVPCNLAKSDSTAIEFVTRRGAP